MSKWKKWDYPQNALEILQARGFGWIPGTEYGKRKPNFRAIPVHCHRCRCDVVVNPYAMGDVKDNGLCQHQGTETA